MFQRCKGLTPCVFSEYIQLRLQILTGYSGARDEMSPDAGKKKRIEAIRTHQTRHASSTKRWPNVGLLLGQRRRLFTCKTTRFIYWTGFVAAIISIPANSKRWSNASLTLSGLNVPLPSPSTTSRELLSQFSTCSGWRWFEVGGKLKKITMYS